MNGMKDIILKEDLVCSIIDRSEPDLPRIMTKGAEILGKIVNESISTGSNGEVTHEAISKAQNYMANYTRTTTRTSL